MLTFNMSTEVRNGADGGITQTAINGFPTYKQSVAGELNLYSE